MRLVRDGDLSKLELLFDRYHSAILHYFHYLTRDRSLAEDLAQETFFRVLKYRRTYQPGAPVRPWLYQIARNVHAGQARKAQPETALPEEAGELSASALPADRQVQKQQETLLLRRALAAMPGEKREVLILSRFLDLKYDEIASILRCETGTVKVRVYRAMRDLSDRFFALSGERAS